jgi:signal transduction histidine kinase
MIERVLSNLLDNALRYTPEGGAIRIAIRAVGQELEVTISDSGPGIPPELREGLFRRPFTVGGARRDGGLGLRIVHQMLELHGVSIHLVEVTDRAPRSGFHCHGLQLSVDKEHRHLSSFGSLSK